MMSLYVLLSNIYNTHTHIHNRIRLHDEYLFVWKWVYNTQKRVTLDKIHLVMKRPFGARHCCESGEPISGESEQWTCIYSGASSLSSSSSSYTILNCIRIHCSMFTINHSFIHSFVHLVHISNVTFLLTFTFYDANVIITDRLCLLDVHCVANQLDPIIRHGQ